MDATTSTTLTCANCGAPLASDRQPCPYCGQMPVPATPASPAGPAQPWATVVVADPVYTPTPASAVLWPMSSVVIAAPRRRSWIGPIILACIVLVSVGLPLFIVFSVLRSVSTAIPFSTAPVFLSPDDPRVVAIQIAPLDAYMKAGAANNADAANDLFIHSIGLTTPDRAAIAAEFQAHADRFKGYQSAQQAAFVRVQSYGGNGSYYELRAAATYADGSSRPVYADMIQHSGWKLLEVTFPDKP